MITIRQVKNKDLEQVTKIEKECFPEPNYQYFFFKQLNDLPLETLIVAEHDSGELAGFCFALKSDIEKQTAWILTIDVSPKYQNQKIGRQLTQAIIIKLFGAGISVIKLTVKIGNENAIKLYNAFGFKICEIQDNYFKDDEKRYIMSLENNQDKKEDLNPELLMGEVGISIAFVNVLFGISTVVISVVSSSDGAKANPEKFYIPLIYLFMILFSSLYASIFYANSTGVISRLKKLNSVSKPIIYGNILSEFFGLFPLTVAIPLLVYAFSNNIFFSYIILSIDLLAFGLYHISKFNILSRYFKSKIAFTSILIFFFLLTIFQLISEINNWAYIKYITTSIILIYLVTLFTIGIKKDEN